MKHMPKIYCVVACYGKRNLNVLRLHKKSYHLMKLLNENIPVATIDILIIPRKKKIMSYLVY